MVRRASGSGRSASLATGTGSRSGFGQGSGVPGAYASAWGCSFDFGAKPPPGLWTLPTMAWPPWCTWTCSTVTFCWRLPRCRLRASSRLAYVRDSLFAWERPRAPWHRTPGHYLISLPQMGGNGPRDSATRDSAHDVSLRRCSCTVLSGRPVAVFARQRFEFSRYCSALLRVRSPPHLKSQAIEKTWITDANSPVLFRGCLWHRNGPRNAI